MNSRDKQPLHSNRRRFVKSIATLGLGSTLIAASTTKASAQPATTGNTDLWIHGHSVWIQEPDSVGMIPFGDGAHFWARNSGIATPQWIHYTIPTPAFLDNLQPYLEWVMVFFNTEGLGVISRIHLWDGDQRILALNVNIGGSHLSNDSTNTFNLPANTHIYRGLGLSIGYNFDLNYAGSEALVITSVGARFHY